MLYKIIENIVNFIRISSLKIEENGFATIFIGLEEFISSLYIVL